MVNIFFGATLSESLNFNIFFSRNIFMTLSIWLSASQVFFSPLYNNKGDKGDSDIYESS